VEKSIQEKLVASWLAEDFYIYFNYLIKRKFFLSRFLALFCIKDVQNYY
jgi:hypothetical protein